jgi:tryptophanyl-tRNA synthetase
MTKTGDSSHVSLHPAHSKKVLLSAVTPSGLLTLGNYLGALKHWMRLQQDYECYFFSVDLHALTTRQDPLLLRDRSLRALANTIAAKVDPEKATLFIQSHVTEHAELAWVLSCFTYRGELNRMTQFKEKSSKEGESVTAGLFNYPVLMASDILLYQTDLVPVGEDQKQHLELTRDIAQRVNASCGKKIFKIPNVYIPPQGARIMNLQNPHTKMAKSDDDTTGNIFLSDSDDQIRKKIKRAVTDSGTEITDEESKPGVRNLLQIQAALTDKSIQEILASYTGKQYGHLKAEVAEIVVTALRPIREKTEELLKNPDYLSQVFKGGAERARERARRTLTQVYDQLGLIGKC